MLSQSILRAILIPIACTCAIAQAESLFTLSDVVTSGAGQNTFAAASGAGGFGGNFDGTTADNLVFTNGGSSAGNGDYFVIKLADYARLQTPGNTLTLSFSLSAANIRNFSASSLPFRFGLFDTDATDGGTDAKFKDATGYSIFTGRKNSTSSSGIFRRYTGAQGNLWDSNVVARISDPDGTDAFNISFTNPVEITGELSIELTTDGHLKITSVIGDSRTSVLTSANVTQFNAISFFTTRGGTTNTLTFNDLSLTFAQVPEPGSAALLLPVLALPVAALLRRRRARR